VHIINNQRNFGEFFGSFKKGGGFLNFPQNCGGFLQFTPMNSIRLTGGTGTKESADIPSMYDFTEFLLARMSV
jgi:hypothetical protein